MRRAHRIDSIHAAVLNILGQAGEAHDLSALGDGWPDILWLLPSCLAVWVECKSDQATRHGRRDEPLRASQEAWRARHPLAPYEIVESLEAAWKIRDKYQPSTGKGAK